MASFEGMDLNDKAVDRFVEIDYKAVSDLQPDNDNVMAESSEGKAKKTKKVKKGRKNRKGGEKDEKTRKVTEEVEKTREVTKAVEESLGDTEDSTGTRENITQMLKEREELMATLRKREGRQEEVATGRTEVQNNERDLRNHIARIRDELKDSFYREVVNKIKESEIKKKSLPVLLADRRREGLILTEKQVLSLIWKEEKYEDVVDKEIYIPALSRFLSTCRPYHVKIDRNRELLLLYYKHMLEADLAEHCAPCSRDLEKVTRQRATFGLDIYLTQSQGVSLVHKRFGQGHWHHQVFPSKINSSYVLVHCKRILLDVLHDRRVREYYPTLVIASTSIQFLEKRDIEDSTEQQFNSFRFWQIPIEEISGDVDVESEAIVLDLKQDGDLVKEDREVPMPSFDEISSKKITNVCYKEDKTNKPCVENGLQQESVQGEKPNICNEALKRCKAIVTDIVNEVLESILDENSQKTAVAIGEDEIDQELLSDIIDVFSESEDDEISYTALGIELNPEALVFVPSGYRARVDQRVGVDRYEVTFTDYGNEEKVAGAQILKDFDDVADGELISDVVEKEKLVPADLRCSLCHGLSRLGKRLICDGSVVCWRCGVTEVNLRNTCWRCGQTRITTSNHLIQDNNLRIAVKEFKKTGVNILQDLRNVESSPPSVSDRNFSTVLNEGDLCFARWSDQVWYNGRVATVLSGGDCVVVFTDYGNSDTVQAEFLVSNPVLIPDGAFVNEHVSR